MKKSVVFVSIAVLLTAAPLMASWEEAMAAFERGEYEAAAKVFATYVKTKTRNPAYANAYHMLGRCQVEMDQPAEGLANLRAALELKPDNVGYRLALGQTLINQREYAEATTVFDELDLSRVAETQRTAVALAHGTAALRAGDPARAVAVAEVRLADDPDSASLHRLAGMAAIEASDDASAFEHLSRSAAIDPGDAAAGAAAVRCALRLAETNESEADVWLSRAYTAAEQLADHSDDEQHLQLAGRVAYRTEHYERAAAWLGPVFRSSPSDAQLGYLYGRSLAETGQGDAAVGVLQRVLEADPDDDLERRTHRQLARLSAHDLDLEAAVRHFRLAGDDEQAASIEEIAAGFGEALDRRRQLNRQLIELEAMATQLEALNDEDGVRALRQQMATARKELEGLDANLEEVRAALKKL